VVAVRAATGERLDRREAGALVILDSWADTLATALIGTDRRPDLAGGSPAALLDRAAALTVARRAGQLPTGGITAPPSAPHDPAPLVGPAAAARLAGLLESGPRQMGGPYADTRAELLVEWLTIAAERGLRVPGEMLPALLDAARRQRELRPLALAAGGPGAGWLATQRDDWRYLGGETDMVGAADPESWELGTVGQRVGYLTATRRTDAAAGRELLAAGWDRESPEDRVALLGALSTGLSTGDEEFLEQALDDRRKEVRAVAVDLLATLPGSAYEARMARRATACLRVGKVLSVTPPDHCDADLRRDGVSARPPAGVGERAWWLEEILAGAPLSVWGESPEAFLARPVTDGWREVVVRGLARAAAARRAADWAGPLIDALLAAPGGRERPDDRLLIESLYTALPARHLVDRTVDALRGGASGAVRLLELCPPPWPARLCDATFAAFKYQAHRPVPSRLVLELSQLAAVRLPVTALAAATTLTAALSTRDFDDPVRRAVEALTDILRFRHDMLEELT